MRRLDRGLFAAGGDIGRQQPLLDAVLDQRPCLGGDFGQPRNAATRRAGFGIDTGEPRDQATAQQRQPRLRVLGHLGIGVGRLERPLDSGLDRALDAAELLVVIESQVAVGAVLDVEPLQREGEQRQRVLGAACLDVGE